MPSILDVINLQSRQNNPPTDNPIVQAIQQFSGRQASNPVAASLPINVADSYGPFVQQPNNIPSAPAPSPINVVDSYGPFVQGGLNAALPSVQTQSILPLTAQNYGPEVNAYNPSQTPQSEVTNLNIGNAPSPTFMSGLQVSGPGFSPVTGVAPTTPAATGTTIPTLTQAGTSILGPTASVVGNTMYTSDGRIITNPIVSDYQQYGLTAPRGTPTVSPRAYNDPFGQLGPSRARFESEYTGIPSQINPNAGFGGIGIQKEQNPYAVFGQGQDVNKAYLSQTGSIILPGGYEIKNPTQADYEQYGIGISQQFGKGAYSKEEQGVYNQIIKAGDSAANILYDSLIANGVDKKTANQMANSVRNDYKTNAGQYRGSAYLPGAQTYKDFYALTPEEFLGNVSENQRSFRPTADMVFNSLSEEGKTQRGIKTVDDAQRILDANPDFKVQYTPEMIRAAADAGNINLGTKLIGVDYDSLKTTDPAQLKAINEATNKYNLGLNLAMDWGLLQGSKSGKTSTGVTVQMASAIAQGLADGTITREEMKQFLPKMSGRGIKEWTEFATDMAKLRGDEDITTADLQAVARGGKAPQLIKGTDNLYTVSTSGGKKGGQYVILEKTGDDSYRIRGGTSTFTPTGGGGFMKYLPIIASIGLAFIPGMQGLAGTIGQTITGASTVGLTEAVLGNAILGAGKSLLTGGDVGVGALAGGVGGGVGQLLGDVTVAGLPLKDSVIGGLANMAAGTVGNLATGQPIMPGVVGGLAGLGAGVLAPEVYEGIRNALPSGTPDVLNRVLTGGALGAGVGAITGQNPLLTSAFGAANPLINYAVNQTGLTGVPAAMATGALTQGMRAGLTGGPTNLGLAAGAIAPVVSYGFDQFGNYVGLDRFGRPAGR